MAKKEKYTRGNIYHDSQTTSKLEELKKMGIKFNKSKFFAEKFAKEFRRLKRDTKSR